MYIIEIQNVKYVFGKRLLSNGFYRKRGKTYCKEVNHKRRFYFWKIRAAFHNCRCYLYQKELHERSNNYRANYFKINSELYHCVYCGKLLIKQEVTVDHLIPVWKAKSGIIWKWYLGKDGVNNNKNLVSACKDCNAKKGVKTGFWLLKGLLGRDKRYFCITKVIKVLLLIFCLLTVSIAVIRII